MIPFVGKNDRPGLYVSTSRMCTGTHDWRCTASQTETYGPFTMDPDTAAGVWVCPTCHRHYPPAESTTAAEPVCLACSNQGAATHFGNAAETTSSLAAVTALRGATAVLRDCQAADPYSYLAILDETGPALRSVLEAAEDAVDQDPSRSWQSLYGAITLIARQILANAQSYAQLATEGE
jgi:hypothetical protein